jgi:hypothetical protein
LRDKELEISLSDFRIEYKRNGLTKTLIQVFGFLLTAYWILDFIETTTIKFFGSLLLFSLVAIIVTWTYVTWLINLTKKFR